jgi:hypothetical protein
MEYKIFLEAVTEYRKGLNMISDLYSIGFDLMEGQYKISEILDSQFKCFIKSHYDEEGVDWVSWFIFENEFGEKDWSKYKTLNRSKDDIFRSISGGKEEKFGARDAEGNPIFYSIESTWEYLEKYNRLK